MVWGPLTRGMSQTRLEVREDRKIYFGILPHFGDLLELIVLDFFFPLKIWRLSSIFFPKNSFGQFTSDYFFVITLSKFDKKRTHAHTHLLLEDKPFSFLIKLTHLRLSNNTKSISNDAALKRCHIAPPLVLWLQEKEVSLYENLFLRVKYGQRWQWVCSLGGGFEVWGLIFD